MEQTECWTGAGSMTKTFEIYWPDLTESCQKRLAEFLDLEEGDDGNYTYIPITIFEVEDE